MKKLFTLIAAAMVGTCAFADVTFHSPGAKLAGAPFEYLNLCNAIVGDQVTTTGGTGKYGISDAYPWIVYNYSASTLKNGGAEVSQKKGCWVSKNLYWNSDEFVQMYKSKDEQNIGSPKVEVGYTKGETYLNKLCPKSMTFYVKSMTRVDLLLSGAGKYTNDADIVVMKANNEVVKTIYVEPMAGQSNWCAADYTNSKWVTVDGLDANESYKIYVIPSMKNAKLQHEVYDPELEVTNKVYAPATEILGEKANFIQDIVLTADQKITNLQCPAVYVAALHMFGTDLSVNGQKPAMPTNTKDFYSPVGNKYSGCGFAYINLSEALQKDAANTTFDATGSPVAGIKYAINDNFPWISYKYSASILDGKFNTNSYDYAGGKGEVARGGYYSSIDPVSGKEEVTYVTDAGGKYLGSPKVEVGFTKDADGFIDKLSVKTMQFNIKEAKRVDVLLTGAGGNTNNINVKLVKHPVTGNDYAVAIRTVTVNGKSNKADGSVSHSQYVTFSGLDANAGYYLVVYPDTTSAQLQVAKYDTELQSWGTAEWKSMHDLGISSLENDVYLGKEYVGYGVKNLKTPTAAVLALRVYGTDVTPNSLEYDINKLIAAGKDTLMLDKNVTYELNGVAKTGYQKFTILTGDGTNKTGDGKITPATIKFGSNGVIQTKKALVIKNVVIEATSTTKPLIQLAPKTDMKTKADTTACYSYLPLDATSKDSIYIFDYENGVQKPYTMCNQRMFVADSVSIINSTLKNVRKAIIYGNDAPWALLKLNIDNCQVYFGKISDPVINFYGGANSVKDINISNSTFASSLINSKFYFLRYTNSSNASPFKAFGYNSQATWTMTNNTFVNMSATQNFANNYMSLGKYTDSTKGVKGNDQVVLTWKKNIFANTYRLQKAGGNNTRNFEYTDNVICGSTNSVDNTDKTSYATEEPEAVLHVYNADNLDVYTDNGTVHDYTPGKFSIANRDKMGDPRWHGAMQTYYPLKQELADLVTIAYDSLAADPYKINLANDTLNIAASEAFNVSTCVDPTTTIYVDMWAAYVKLADALRLFDVKTLADLCNDARELYNMDFTNPAAPALATAYDKAYIACTSTYRDKLEVSRNYVVDHAYLWTRLNGLTQEIIDLKNAINAFRGTLSTTAQLNDLYAQLAALYTVAKQLLESDPTNENYATLFNYISEAYNIIVNKPYGADGVQNEMVTLRAAMAAFKNHTTGINNVAAEGASDNGKAYNIAGQSVSGSAKGLIIKNGRKYFNK